MSQNPTTQSVAIRSADLNQYPLKVNSDGSINTNTGGGGSNVTVAGPLGQAASAASLPVVIASDQSAIKVSPQAVASGAGNFTHIAAGQATTTVKTGAGTLYSIVLNSKGTATNVTTIYDSVTATGAVIGIPDAVSATADTSLNYGPVGLAFSNGLTINTATANGGDMTVVWK